MSLTSIIEENGIILIGILIAVVVMGTTSLYDKYQREGKISYKSEIKQFSELKNNLKKIQLNQIQFSKLKLIQTDFLKKIQNIKFGKLQEKLNFQNLKKEVLKLSQPKHENSNNSIDKLVESKREELNFDDSLLTEMSTGNNFKAENSFKSESSPALAEESVPENEFSELSMPLDADFKFDNNELNIGFEEKEEKSPEEGALFEDNLEDLDFDEETDNLLDSLKKDIVVKKEEKINFMADIKGESLDLQSLKSEMEDILKDLKKIKSTKKKC